MHASDPALAESLRAAGDALVRAAQALQRQPVNGRPANGNGRAPSEPKSGFRDDLLTARQLGAIHAVGRRAGLSRDALAKLARDLTGRDQLSELSRSEASTVIDHLQEAAGR